MSEHDDEGDDAEDEAGEGGNKRLEEHKQIMDDEYVKNADPVVARPTTKPLDKGRRREVQEKPSYTFWTEKDPAKLSSFPQFQDAELIKPKKLADPKELEDADKPTLSRTGSAWNKGATWEDKVIGMDALKKYLESTPIIIAESESAESKLTVKKVKSVTGTASIAVVRGEPKMGYELTLAVSLEGVEGTYLQGMACELEVEELVEYQNEPDSFNFEVTTLLDTEQGAQAKECIGYDNECDLFCTVIRRILGQYPYQQNV